MKRWFRQQQYASVTAARRLWTQPFSSISNLLVIALTLALPILGAAILVSAQPIVKQVPVSPEITLFLRSDAPAELSKKTAERIRSEYPEQVQSVRAVSRQQALETLKANPNWSNALSALPGNPLPDAVIVTLKESPELAQHTDALAREWRQWEQVDLVQFDSAWVQRLEAILRFIRIGLGFLAIGVALVVLATVFNTVRMQALSQREEIAVARLVGATESFVRRPFLYLGALTGFMASLLAIGLSALALIPLNSALDRLAQSYGTELSLQLPDPVSLMLAVIVVAILAALSARWSVTRTTRF